MFAALSKKKKGGAVPEKPAWLKEEEAIAERKRERIKALEANRASQKEAAAAATVDGDGIVEDATKKSDDQKKKNGGNVATQKGGRAAASDSASGARKANTPNAAKINKKGVPQEAVKLLKEASTSDLRKLRQHHSYGSGVHKKTKNNKFANAIAAANGESTKDANKSAAGNDDDDDDDDNDDENGGTLGISNQVNIFSKKKTYSHLQNSIDAFVEKANEEGGDDDDADEEDDEDDDDAASSSDNDDGIDNASDHSDSETSALGRIDDDPNSFNNIRAMMEAKKKNGGGKRKNNTKDGHKSKPWKMTKYSRRVGTKIKSSHEDRNKKAAFNKERGVQFRVNKGRR